ncbi:hypothetical protein PF008_g11503 [Phytophthora fragariae]|nr:hypothetical protein PF008_g11503 [Phytophthora fragariae]
MALAGCMGSVAQQKVMGYSGLFSNDALTLSNEGFQALFVP